MKNLFYGDKKENLPKISSLLRFVLPAFFGLVIFLIPLPYKGNYMITIVRITNWVHLHVQHFIPNMLLILFCVGALGSLFATALRPGWIMRNSWANQLFIVSPITLLIRCIGAIWSLAIYYKKGPTCLIASETGLLIWQELLPILLINLSISSLFIPFLLDFGLLEFLGVLISPIMRPLFDLPGEASLNALIAWVGDGSLGSLIALQQYEKNKYTPRETIIVISCFAAPSITFCISVLVQAKLPDYFISFYATLIISSIFAAFIIARIPPITWQKHLPPKKNKNKKQEYRFRYALHLATRRARKSSLICLVRPEQIKNLLSMLISLLPSVMVIGGVSLIIAHYTPLIKWLGKPFIPLLRIAKVPDAQEVAEVLFIGFTDMVLPTLMIIKTNTEPISRFIVAALSITQIIYLSELGALLLSSNLPCSFRDLFFIFVLRTLLTLPIIILFAHFIF